MHSVYIFDKDSGDLISYHKNLRMTTLFYMREVLYRENYAFKIVDQEDGCVVEIGNFD